MFLSMHKLENLDLCTMYKGKIWICTLFPFALMHISCACTFFKSLEAVTRMCTYFSIFSKLVFYVSLDTGCVGRVG